MAECVAIGGRDGFQPVTTNVDKVNSPDGKFVQLEAPHRGKYDEALAVAKGTIQQDCASNECGHYNKDCFPQAHVDSRRALLIMFDHYPVIMGLNQKNKGIYE